MSPAQTVDKSVEANQPIPDSKMERLGYYLLLELQTEIEKGNKWADEVRFRAFKRMEAKK